MRRVESSAVGMGGDDRLARLCRRLAMEALAQGRALGCPRAQAIQDVGLGAPIGVALAAAARTACPCHPGHDLTALTAMFEQVSNRR